MCSFSCLHHQLLFFEKATSLLKIASILWYLKKNLSLLSLFDRNVGLTTKCTMVKVSKNVEENKPLSQARVDMTNTKKQTLAECVTKNCRRLLCLTDQLEVLHRAPSNIFSRCLSSTHVPYPVASYGNPTSLVEKYFKNTTHFQASSVACSSSPESINLSALGPKSVINHIKEKKLSWWLYYLSTEETLLFLREPLIICPPNFLWTPIKFTMSSSIPNCSGLKSSNLEYAKNQLLSLLPSDT